LPLVVVLPFKLRNELMDALQGFRKTEKLVRLFPEPPEPM
jgi:hypothetical protein